jgi:transposase-like protein
MFSPPPTTIESCPRYQCKRCTHNFTIAKLQHGIEQQYVALCLKLYLEGLGFRAIERVVGVSHVRVINWVKKYDKALTMHLSKGRNYQLLRWMDFVAT